MKAYSVSQGPCSIVNSGSEGRRHTQGVDVSLCKSQCGGRGVMEVIHTTRRERAVTWGPVTQASGLEHAGALSPVGR